jgi:hypothetical protein
VFVKNWHGHEEDDHATIKNNILLLLENNVSLCDTISIRAANFSDIQALHLWLI